MRQTPERVYYLLLTVCRNSKTKILNAFAINCLINSFIGYFIKNHMIAE